MLAVSRTGHELIEIMPCAAPVPPDDGIPLTFTQVVAMHQGRLLLIYNRSRSSPQWETPGGGLEPNEAPDACAIRELFEESGQRVEQVTFKGLFKIRLNPEGTFEYGALYTATLSEIQPFEPNDEVERIVLWREGDALDGEIGSFTAAFLQWCRANP